MIDYNEIGSEVTHLYRPYLWFGDEQDTHVVEYKKTKVHVMTIDDCTLTTPLYYEGHLTAASYHSQLSALAQAQNKSLQAVCIGGITGLIRSPRR
jgi:hypothetical protein